MITTIALEELTADSVARHGVVRLDAGRKLSAGELVDVARRVGKPKAFGLAKYRPDGFPPEATLIDTHGDGMTAAPRGFGEGWHQDSTFLAAPPEFTVLHAWDVPDCGGDTLFADTRPALSELSAGDVEALEELRLEHCVRGTYRIAPSDAGRRLEEVRASLPAAGHPAVLRHPRGGTTLLLSPLYTNDSLPPEDRPLFERALAAVVRGQAAHRWRAGEILVWDNRVVLHAATPYVGEQRRRLVRIVVDDAAGAAS
jgi:taurine dioxygenase